MDIVIYGAGAIGSLFGGLLANKNNVILIGRKDHINEINKNKLKINGETNKKIAIPAYDKIDKINNSPDLIILTVKSYDTKNAIKQIKPIFKSDILIMSLQNGLGNVEILKKYISENQILACITTHGAIFSKPGIITHSGVGKTTIGSIIKPNLKSVEKIVKNFNRCKIKTTISSNIIEDIWLKAIINSSINPLTTIFNCKNGYLLENPILEKVVERICKESTEIANSEKIKISYEQAIKKTREVIFDTSNNYSSMLQSIKKKRKTEIESINGKLFEMGRKNKIECFFNQFLLKIIEKQTT